MVYYINPVNEGIISVSSAGDGYTITLKWDTAYPSVSTNKIAYQIYMATDEDAVFSEGVKFISIGGVTTADIFELTPGELYHFAVRAIEYNPILIDPTLLPETFSSLRVAPQSVLRADISATDTTIPLLNSEDFPTSGIIKLGVELINYTGNNISLNNLTLAGSAGSGATLVDQGSPSGSYYKRGTTNSGDGYIRNLTLINGSAPTETWTIKCTVADGYGSGPTLLKIAKFEAFGSISGVIRDGYGDPFIWDDTNQIISNGILSFSIDGYAINSYTPFITGDYFTIKVSGPVASVNIGRGFDNTTATPHDTDGYDGITTWSPYATFTLGREEMNTKIFSCQSRFDVDQYAFTETDGYHQIIKDIITTDLSGSDASNVDFPTYDYAGWHRTNPADLFGGGCAGSYFGGQQGCADGETVRGLSVQEQNNQRQEMLLNMTGEPVCLIRKRWTGITCPCYLPSSESPDDRCTKCYGTKFLVGWDQYYNPRRSDSRILIRFSPAEDDVKIQEAGLESEFITECWGLTVPTIKDRDILVRFDQDGNEEFRYEVLSVNRNKTLFGLQGAQKFKVQRIRRTDPAYTIKVFRDTATLPSRMNTTVGSASTIPPHVHEIVITNQTADHFGQITSVILGHSHPVVFKDGQLQVLEVLGHKHDIIL